MPASREPTSRRARRAEAQARPIAASLGLADSHVALIDHSHERCVALGVSRISRPDFAPLGRPDLNVVRERNLRLHTHAAPVMEMLVEQIDGTESMVVLCDATGTVIHAVGDDGFLARASRVALQPGVNWSEQAKGTNAIGTALFEETPTLVHADEHFMHANHFLTCSAAPILDPRGNILGVLDVTGDHRSYHQHTMALVRMSARMIENHWLAEDHRKAMRLHFHPRVEFIGTLMEGILAVTPDGRIVGANRSALELLGTSGAALRMQSLVSLFGTSVGALVDRFRSPLAIPMVVHTESARDYHLHARFSWPVWSDITEAAAATHAPPPVGAVSANPPSSLPSAPVAPSDAPGLEHLLLGDSQIASLVVKLRRVQDRDIPVLILGETGTGKELLARAIHRDSARNRRPFVAVNCASIPETLIEAELFGYEEGTFTGARRKGAVGRIQQASGGTLFLDEIGDMPPALQARLLRVLQERMVTPLGSGRSTEVALSIICSTQRDLRELIGAHAFREDLYYRLNGLAVRLPPLRERTDLKPLVRRILDNDVGSPGLVVAAETLALFQNCTWPGNVRQLHNVLRTAAVMAGSERMITPSHLPDDFVAEALRAALPVDTSSPAAPPMSLEEIEVDAIRRAVDAAGGNISEAAKRLGISRNTIYRKLRPGSRSST